MYNAISGAASVGVEALTGGDALTGGATDATATDATATDATAAAAPTTAAAAKFHTGQMPAPAQIDFSATPQRGINPNIKGKPSMSSLQAMTPEQRMTLYKTSDVNQILKML